VNTEKYQVTKAATSKKSRPKIKGVTPADISDLTRKTGDVAVYKYYFKSIGLASAVLFFCSAAILVFATYFPRKYNLIGTDLYTYKNRNMATMVERTKRSSTRQIYQRLHYPRSFCYHIQASDSMVSTISSIWYLGNLFGLA
jgi:hypothetical protein